MLLPLPVFSPCGRFSRVLPLLSLHGVLVLSLALAGPVRAAEAKISVYTDAVPDPLKMMVDDGSVPTFPNTPPGTVSDPRVLTILNSGDAALTNFSFSVGGSFPGDYVVTAPLSSSLAPGETTTFTISFAPKGTGLRRAKISLASNAVDVGTFRINVSGRMTRPEIAIEEADGTLIETGKLVGWQRNGRLTPIAEILQHGVKEIALDDFVGGLALKTDGKVFGFFQGSIGSSTWPVDIGPVKAISVAGDSSLVVLESGAISRWIPPLNGKDRYPANVTNATAISQGSDHAIALRSDGSVVGWGDGAARFIPPAIQGGIHGIASGDYHNLALYTDGTVATWTGQEPLNQSVYLVPGASELIAIASKNSDSMGVRADGTLVRWAVNMQLKKIPGIKGAAAVSMADFGFRYAVLKKNGTVQTVSGDDTTAQNIVPEGLHSVTSVAAGIDYTYAIVNTRVDFGNRVPGTASIEKNFVVKNTGDAPLQITGVTLSGAGAADFTVDTTGMLATVPPGGQTTFRASYSPGAPGFRDATVRVTNDDENENFYDIRLRGSSRPEMAFYTGGSAVPLEGPVDVDFGNFPLGVAGTIRTYTIRNNGVIPLDLGAVTLTGTGAAQFQSDTTAIPSSLAPGAEASFTVGFLPTTAGSFTATLRVPSNDPEVTAFDFLLAGSGFDPEGLTALEFWRMTHFGTVDLNAATAMLGDFDNDGVSNLLEYAFGTNPTANTPAEQRVRTHGAGLDFSFSYQRPVGGAVGVIYQVEQSSPALTSWSTAVEGTDYTRTVTPNGDGTETVKITLAGGDAGKRFARVKVGY